MKVSIMQPAYLPWAGYCQRIMQSDVHIVFDDVKIDWHSKTQFTNRNRILGTSGPLWLSLPIAKQKSADLLIKDIVLAETGNWRKKHYQSLRQGYARARHYQEHDQFLREFFNTPFTKLSEAIKISTEYILNVLNIRTPCYLSSEINAAGTKSALVLNLCRAVGASEYISGPYGRDYLDLASFAKAGISVSFHDFKALAYPQTKPGFTPYLSVLDMIFNVGAKQSRALLSGECNA